MNIYKVYYHSIMNEINIDQEVMTRIYNTKLKFTPLRTIKTFKYIQKYKISKSIYLIINILFFSLYPFITLGEMIHKYISRCKLSIKIQNQQYMALNSHHKLIDLIQKNNIKKEILFLDIKDNYCHKQKNHIHISQILSTKDYIIAYAYSIIGIIYLLFKLKHKTDILQGYVSYHWFLTYIGLQKISKNINTVYFSNHYDRWSVMYDNLFKKNILILMQHGILPSKLLLTYKLKNINYIYIFNQQSHNIFNTLFNNSNVHYIQMDYQIQLTDTSTSQFSILIIGQPQSIEKEIEIIKSINDKYYIYIKPHPLFSNSEYKDINNTFLIEKKDFFPKVNLALSYESTLGYEYMSAGIDVLWWKDMDLENILFEISNKVSSYDH